MRLLLAACVVAPGYGLGHFEPVETMRRIFSQIRVHSPGERGAKIVARGPWGAFFDPADLTDNPQAPKRPHGTSQAVAERGEADRLTPCTPCGLIVRRAEINFILCRQSTRHWRFGTIRFGGFRSRLG